MKCPGCGIELRQNANFCGFCGFSSGKSFTDGLPLGVGCARYEPPDKFLEVFDFTQVTGKALEIASGEFASAFSLARSDLTLVLALLWVALLGFLHAFFAVSTLGILLAPATFFCGYFFAFLPLLVAGRILGGLAVDPRTFFALFVFQHPQALLLTLPFTWSRLLFLILFFSMGNRNHFFFLKEVLRLDPPAALKALFLANLVWLLFVSPFVILGWTGIDPLGLVPDSIKLFLASFGTGLSPG